MTMELALVHGEGLAVPERVIVAPASGRFRPASADAPPPEGHALDEEQVIGFVDGVGHSTPLRNRWASARQARTVRARTARAAIDRRSIGDSRVRTENDQNFHHGFFLVERFRSTKSFSVAIAASIV